MVEPGCEYRPLAPGILQGFAVRMFQKASVPGPVRVKEAHSVPCTRPPASLQSLGLHFLHQGNLRGSLPGPWPARHSCVHCPAVPSAQWGQLCSTGVPGSRTHAGAGFGLFSETRCPNYGGGWGLFHFQIETKLFH